MTQPKPPEAADRSEVYPRIITPQIYVAVQRDGEKYFAKFSGFVGVSVGNTESEALIKLTSHVEEYYSWKR